MSPSSLAPARRKAGPAAKRKPLPSRSTSRSCQHPFTLRNWRTGKASKNSLAIQIVGPSGIVSGRSCQTASKPCARWRERSAGDVSTRCTSGRNAGSSRAARSASAISTPAPRPELDHPDIRRPSEPFPGIDAPEPDDLAEHLADLGRRDEVAAAPERVAAGIVGGVVQRHELGQRDRPVAFDAPGKPRCQAAAHWRRTSRKSPATISGRQSSCPIVTGPRMNPRCASGSRKSSAKDRASP